MNRLNYAYMGKSLEESRKIVLTIFQGAHCIEISVQNFMDKANHIGAELRDARLARGLTYDDISEVTKIRPEFLGAIETLSTDNLPSIGYVLGYVRSYAKFLGMDSGSAVARYKVDSEVPDNLGVRKLPHFIPTRNIRLPRGFVPATMVLAVAGMLTLWYGTQTETQASVTTIADLSIVEQPQVSMTDPDLVTVRALAPSWIQIKDKSGRILISRIFVTGETWQTPRGSGTTLSARDGGAIQLYIGETNAGEMGERGVAVTDISLNNPFPPEPELESELDSDLTETISGQ